MVRRLNLKLIALFFLALWLMNRAGEILGYLKNPTLAEQIRRANGDTSILKGEDLTAVNLTGLLVATGFASLLGLIAGLIISIVICKKRNWHWINPVLSSIIIYLTGWLQVGGINFIERLLRMPGEIFDGIGYYLINGLVRISLALIFMFIAKMKTANSHPGRIKPQSA